MLLIQDYIELLQKDGIFVACDCKITDIQVSSITYDSRKVQPGTLFVCKGAHFKEEYAISALQNGAVALVCEQKTGDVQNCILVSDIRKAISVIANAFHGGVQHQLVSIGLTGTKGKSTTAYFIRSVLDHYFQKNEKPRCALISSIETYDGIHDFTSHITTPEPFELYEYIHNAVDAHLSHLVMEVSSQALKYGRVDGLFYNVAAFTNIGMDHISPIEHKDFDDYFQSKLKIFDMCKVACINADSEHFDEIYDYASKRCEVVTYGVKSDADIHCTSVEKKNDEIEFSVNGLDFSDTFSITIPGMFNVSNAMTAIAVLHVLGIPIQDIKEGLKTVSIPGRMQMYSSQDDKIKVVVDYAHNQLSFDTLFASVKKEYPEREIITVFGCPGDKAILRRQGMGESANLNSDFIFVTEDDPGEEGFEKIAKEIETYLTTCPHEKIMDRSEAIKQAIFKDCEKSKIVLVLGKGQEVTQKRGTVLEPYPSDAVVACQCLKEYDK